MFRTSLIVYYFIISVFSSSAFAHDFWLEPNTLKSEKPTATTIKFKVGHLGDSQDWGLSWDKIVSIKQYHASGVNDLAASVIPKRAMVPGIAKTDVLESGTHIISFESYHSVSSLKAEKFNRYIESAGLSDIAEHRKQNKLTETAGTEIYSRKAKSIIQIGNEVSPFSLKPVGHTLEIVPNTSVFDLKDQEMISFTVYFRGQPLEGAKVELTSLRNPDLSSNSSLTNASGVAEFSKFLKGDYRLSVIWGVPIDNARADYETYFSTLTIYLG